MRTTKPHAPIENAAGDDEFRPSSEAGEVPAPPATPPPLRPADDTVHLPEASVGLSPTSSSPLTNEDARPPCVSAPHSGATVGATGNAETNGAASQPEPARDAAGSGDGGKAAAEEDEATGGLNDSASDALREFYALARELDDAGKRQLWEKRGLVPSFVAWAGLKWCHADNTRVIHEMAARYTKGAMLRAGLMQVTKGGSADSARANRQFCGWGRTGRKVAAPPDDDSRTRETEWDAAPPSGRGRKPKPEAEWGETNPLLIPYFNEDGHVTHLRPHKGMLTGVPNHFFVARPCRRWQDAHAVEMERARKPVRMAVICEGELKAIAVAQALWPSVAAGSTQGITNAKDWFVMDPLCEWLEGLNHADDFRVVVVYDNEEKGNPSLPGYTAREDARHDSIVWARFLAEELERKAWHATVGVLPAAWRDASGKADWDGALAKLIRETLL